MSKETEDLCKAVDDFANAMKARLIQKHKQGLRGWNSGSRGVDEKFLLSCVFDKTTELMRNPRDFGLKHLVDLANYAMMLWYRRNKKL